MKPPMPAPPNKGRFRKPFPAREGGSGAKAERDRKEPGRAYESAEGAEHDRHERAEQRKRVRST